MFRVINKRIRLDIINMVIFIFKTNHNSLIHHEFDYIYDGKWKQGKMHGFGKLRKGTKMTFYYEGYFKDNEFDGKVSSNLLHCT